MWLVKSFVTFSSSPPLSLSVVGQVITLWVFAPDHELGCEAATAKLFGQMTATALFDQFIVALMSLACCFKVSEKFACSLDKLQIHQASTQVQLAHYIPDKLVYIRAVQLCI